MKSLSIAVLILVFSGLLQTAGTVNKPPIYDPAADIKAQIDAALPKAKAEQKNILLMFGANWCPWCHLLHELFAADPAIKKLLAERYILIMVDTGEVAKKPLNQDIVEKYTVSVRQYGLPCLAVLDSNGLLVCTQSTGVLEKGKAHDPGKVLSFLNMQL